MNARRSSSGAQTLRALVTHLEMDAPPRSYPPLPIGRQMALMRCRDMPLHFYRYLYDRVGRAWHWTAALRLGDEALAERLQSPQTDVQVLYVEGCPSGFFELRLLSQEECRLVHFGLMAHANGTGLGHWFLGAAVQAAWAHGPRLVSVETCTLDHPAALALYQKMGFEPVWRKEENLVTLSEEERAAVLMR